MNVILCFIKRRYFEEHKEFVKMLDSGNSDKQSKRTHLCVKIAVDGNSYYIPLRNNLGDEVRKYGRIGHSIPSKKRRDAGLDYRYAIIINDESYIEYQSEKKIPESQYRKILKDYDVIVAEFALYLKGYVKAAKKKRHEKEPLYRESGLINFWKELGIK